MQRQHPKTELAVHIAADLLRRRLGSECFDSLKARLSQRYRLFATAFALRASGLPLPARGLRRGIVCGSVASAPPPTFRCCTCRGEARQNTLSRFEFGKLLDQFFNLCASIRAKRSARRSRWAPISSIVGTFCFAFIACLCLAH